MKRIIAALALFLPLSGCMGFSHHESSMTYNGTTFRHVDDDDYIRVTAVGTNPPSWDDLSLTQLLSGTVRVRLNLAPTQTTGHELRQGEEWHAGGLGSGAVKMGDRIRFCAVDGQAVDGEIRLAIVQASSGMRHMSDHEFQIPLPVCAGSTG